MTLKGSIQTLSSILILCALMLFLTGCGDTPTEEGNSDVSLSESETSKTSEASEDNGADQTKADGSAETTDSNTEGASSPAPEQVPMKKGEAVESGKEIATLGGGCFWCTEAVMERLEGVSDVVSGYMGGHVENPTYEQVCTKTTGHAEVIQITYDPKVITFDEILDVFWQAHDPTTLNQQGADRGPQYRSVVFYHSAAQRNAAEQSRAKLDASGMYPDPAVTEITKADTFWVAEDGHQDYYELNKDTNPYCRVVISPKLKKLGME